MIAGEENKPKQAAEGKKSGKGAKKKASKASAPALTADAEIEKPVDEVTKTVETEVPNPPETPEIKSEDPIISEPAKDSVTVEPEVSRSRVGLEQMSVPTFEATKLTEEPAPDSVVKKPLFTAGENPLIFKWDGTRLPLSEFDNVETYNFRNPGFLSQSDLRQLSISHEKFLLHLSARLSTLLRLECSMKLLKFESSIFNKFTESIKGTTHLTLFQVEPLLGVGLLEVSIPFGLAVADRLLGGKGQVEEANRNFSEIELTLLEDTIGIIFDEWAQQWPTENLRPECIGHETSGRFLQISPPDALIVVLNIEIVMGESLDQMRMEIPYSMLEPMVKKNARRT